VIEKRREQDAVVLTLSGELDLASAPMLERELLDAEATGPSRLVIDLAGLAFMDSTGLQALLRARERANSNGHELALRRAPHQVQRVFELTKTVDAFTFED
jgi:anti-anti-sigma factor